MPRALVLDEPHPPTALLMRTGEGAWWAEAMMRQKKEWVRERRFKGDMPPVVMGLRGGSVVVYVISPHLDKASGYEAAQFARVVFGIDTVFMTTDGHMPLGEHADRVYGPGEMQRRCDEEGACAHKELTDCLSVIRVTATGGTVVHNLTYDYEEMKGEQEEVKWTPDHDFIIGAMVGDFVAGEVPDTLHGAMDLPPVIPSEELAKQLYLAGYLTLKDRMLPVDRAVRLGLVRNARAVGYRVWDLSDAPIRVE